MQLTVNVMDIGLIVEMFNEAEVPYDQHETYLRVYNEAGDNVFDLDFDENGKFTGIDIHG